LALTHYKNVQDHKAQLDPGEELAVGCYAYFNKSKA
jgi:hypothetical protein